MASQEEFKEFYHKHLVPHLEELESVRQKISRQVVVFISLFTIFVLVSTLYLSGFNNFSLETIERYNFIIAIVSLVAGFAIGLVIYQKMFKSRLSDFRSDYKRTIIERVVKYVDDGLDYDQDELVTEAEYRNSKIFPIDAKVYYGEDFLQGKKGKILFRFSELHTQTYLKDHRGRKAYMTIFQGLFFVAKFKRRFKGETVILPDTAQKLFGEFGKQIQKYNWFRDSLVEVADQEFGKEFVVYSSDPDETKNLLTEQLAKRILDFRNATGHRLSMSFIENCVNVAIPLNLDLFEPPLYSSMLDFETIFDDYRYLSIATGIVDDLDLNADIWLQE